MPLSLLLVKRLFLAVMAISLLFFQEQCDNEERRARDQYFADLIRTQGSRQRVHVAEGGSGTANSVKEGTGAPVPGSAQGTGKEVVAAPAAGAGAKSLLLSTFGSMTQIQAIGAAGTVSGGFTVSQGFANMSVSQDGMMIAGTVGTSFWLYNPAGTTLLNVNLTNAVPAPASAPIPAGIAMMPDSSGAYVTDRVLSFYYYVDFKTRAISAFPITIATPGSGKPAVLPNGLQLWIPSTKSNLISVFDTWTNTPVTTVAGINAPSEIAFTADGTNAAVLSQSQAGPGSVFAVDTGQYKVLGSAFVGMAPMGLSRNPFGTSFWTANSNSGTITEVNLTGGAPVVLQTAQVGSNPVGVAVFNTWSK